MKWFRRKPKQAPRRRGVLELEAVGEGWLNKGMVYLITLEVEEIEQIAGFSKVRILSCHGCEKGMIERDFGTLWPTHRIRWEHA